MSIITKINMLFGKKIKELREEQGLLQRQLAAALEIDTPMYSKIERGDRRAKRSQVILLADLLLTIWLADKILDAIADEPDYALPAIDIVDEQLHLK
jgi:transcriptional regulator with XRE-family HTH domain